MGAVKPRRAATGMLALQMRCSRGAEAGGDGLETELVGRGLFSCTLSKGGWRGLQREPTGGLGACERLAWHQKACLDRDAGLAANEQGGAVAPCVIPGFYAKTKYSSYA
jgi:hypothetical protein